MKLITTFALVVFAACTPADSVSEPTSIPLMDPCTGDVIGAKNVSTGEYRFDDGAMIDEARIEPAAQEFEVCGDVASASNKFCWVMVEGTSLGCAGCCTHHGGSTYTCSEYCWDSQT